MAETTEPVVSTSEDLQMPGQFAAVLNRGNKRIKKDRAEVIIESAQMAYKRRIEDMELSVKQLNRTRENMLDLSPTTADSLKLAGDFDANKFVTEDLKIASELIILDRKIEAAKARYAILFT
jgi:hypothetical protein